MLSNLTKSEKISKIASLIIEGQSQTNQLLKGRFGSLGLQNSQLLSDNQQFNDRLVNLQDQLEDISKELTEKKTKRKVCSR